MLRLLVAAAQQHNDRRSTPNKLNSIARTIVDPHFRNAFAYGPDIAGIAQGQPAQPNIYARNRMRVSKIAQPNAECLSLANLDAQLMYPIEDTMSTKNLAATGGATPRFPQ